MNSRTSRRGRRGCKGWMVSAVALAMAGPAAFATRAAVVSWNNAGGGSWNTPNWTGGVGTNAPTSGDSASFGLAATYSIDLNISPTISGVVVGASNVTFTNGAAGRTLVNNGTLNVGPGSFTLSATTPVNWTNNNTIFFNGNATISNGNDLSGVAMGLGNTAAATVTVTGAGTTFNMPGAATISNGTLTLASAASAIFSGLNMATATNGNANLNVQSGATLSAQGLSLAASAAAGKTASVTVTGTNSTLTNTGVLLIGAASLSSATMTVGGGGGGAVTTSGGALTVDSTGLLDIQAGGAFTINSQPVALGSGDGTQGRILVSGAAANFTQSGAVAVTVGGASGSVATIQTSGGGNFSTGTNGVTINAAGLIDIAAGGTFTLNGNATVNGTLQRSATGTLSWVASKTMTVQNGGDLLVTGSYALPSAASLTVTGAGSSLVQSTSGTLTIAGGSTLNIAAGAAVSAFAERLSEGGGGTVNQSGGTHSVAGASSPLVIGPGFGATGTYNLSGGNLNVTNDDLGAPGEVIGNFGVGSFVQTGGSHSINGNNASLVIGASATGSGTYTLSNSAGLDCASMKIGRDSGASGTLTLAAGSNAFVIALQGPLELGLNLVASGTANANGGFLGANGIFVGGSSSAGGGTGVLNVAGGQVDATSIAGMPTSGQVRVWNTNGSAINLSAGTLTCDSLNTSGNPSRFHWTGNGRLNINGAGGFDVSAGGPLGANLVLDGGKQLFVAHTTNIAAGASLALVESTLMTGALSGNGALSSDLNSIIVGLDDSSATFTGTITGAGSLAKTGTGTQTISYARIYGLSVTGGTLKVAATGGSNDRTSVVGNLNVLAGARLDLTDNKLIARDLAWASTWSGSAYAGIAGLIQSGFHGGDFQGSGIVSSLPAAAAGLTAFGYAPADRVGYAGGTFGGQSVAAADLLVMYTYAGDANLDGFISGDDYTAIDFNIAVPGATGWFNGDFNYDGIISGDDYSAIDFSIVAQGTPFPTTTAAAALAGATAVPEPQGIALLAAGMLMLTTRSRRCSKTYRGLISIYFFRRAAL